MARRYHFALGAEMTEQDVIRLYMFIFVMGEKWETRGIEAWSKWSDGKGNEGEGRMIDYWTR